MRILIVEDDIQLAEMLAEALTDRQYSVDLVRDGETARRIVGSTGYDLIILDLALPKLDGISFCQWLRSQNHTLPVLILTARDTVDDKIIGLDAGADDYVVKPCNLRELMARVRALLRRGKLSSSAELIWGVLHLDSGTYEVTYQEQLVYLTPKEYALLELLVAGGRRVLSRSEIAQRIWSSDDSPSEATVKSHVRSIRQKLKAVGAPEDLIETVHGLGYRLKQLPKNER
jgi:DNA-binding response OmpR family regulator